MQNQRTHRTLARTAGAAGLGLVLAVGLAACGNDTSGSSSTTSDVSTTDHNDADVTFASDMIQHHAQALSMVDLTIDRQLDPEVQALAEEIRAAQAPEIEIMADWLTGWGEEVPATMRDHVNSDEGMDGMEGMEGMDHGSSDMPGMMTTEDMSALESASNADFQDMWLEMMMEHHQGAIEMAQTEQSDGQHKDAIDLAGQIVDTQTAEIETIKGILGS